jgi:hypothetical protein
VRGKQLLRPPPPSATVATTAAGPEQPLSLRLHVTAVPGDDVAADESLGLWGGVAGRRAGLSGWRLALTVLGGLVVGSVILVLQVMLQPGKAVVLG